MRKPNLLFLFTDQQRHDTLAVGGNSKIRVPNLNRLAEQSVVFKQAYVTQSVCTPSRGSIMTGLYPHNHGAIGLNVPLPVEIPTIVELMEDQSYRTGYVGKWHLGDEVFAQRKSLVPAMKEEQSLDDNDVFIEWNGDDSEEKMFKPFRKELQAELEHVSGAAVRTIITPDGWKMSLSSAGENELYHLAEDPYEMDNLYFKQFHDGKIAELTDKITAWQKKTNDEKKVQCH